MWASGAGNEYRSIGDGVDGGGLDGHHRRQTGSDWRFDPDDRDTPGE